MTDSTNETPVLDLRASMTADSVAASSLDPATLMLVRIAALIAVDAPSITAWCWRPTEHAATARPPDEQPIRIGRAFAVCGGRRVRATEDGRGPPAVSRRTCQPAAA